MSSDAFHVPSRLPSRRVPRPDELLFEFVRISDRAQFRCELRYRGDFWGVEAEVFKQGCLLIARRFETKALAMRWAELERQQIENGGA
jgi:hypothetical protein